MRTATAQPEEHPVTEPFPPQSPPPLPPQPPTAPAPPLGYAGPTSYPPPGPVKPNFGMQAAKASWVAPIIAVALNFLTNGAGPQARAVSGFVSLGLYIVGLILGIVALAGVRKYGRKGVLVPAIVGVCINGALVLLFALVIGLFVSRR